MRLLFALAALVLAWSTPALARAFCGFYVSSADGALYADATMVVLFRDGTRTVLSMRNNYEGPPEDFAMVVPVPVVLREDQVRTLPHGVFDRVDALAAPRLVEYWEQDPCAQQGGHREGGTGAAAAPNAGNFGVVGPAEGGVVVEAEFAVGEYEIVLLSASEAAGLDRWLRERSYRIPERAAAAFAPYIEGGWKFFVAKVNLALVERGEDGTVLSPLRFWYDDDAFRLPVRLGLLNSKGSQDLIIHVLAKDRYEVANYPSAQVPTNVEVKDAARTQFREVYAALFDSVLKQTPGAVVTEYAWDSGSCDPCPTPPLEGEELWLLGADTLPAWAGPHATSPVLTRLHARYDKDGLGEDLVFRVAPPLLGGRAGDLDGSLGVAAGVNNFQSRFIIRHAWEGPVSCAEPIFGRWGGPPPGTRRSSPGSATGLGFAERGGVRLEELVLTPLPSLGLSAPQAGGSRAAILWRLAVGAALGLAAVAAALALGARRATR